MDINLTSNYVAEYFSCTAELPYRLCILEGHVYLYLFWYLFLL